VITTVLTLMVATTAHVMMDIIWKRITLVVLVCVRANENENIPTLLLILDIDECKTDNGGCNQNCTNTPGSYHCSCLDGYEMMDDNHTCSGKLTATPGTQQSSSAVYTSLYSIYRVNC